MTRKNALKFLTISTLGIIAVSSCTTPSVNSKLILDYGNMDNSVDHLVQINTNKNHYAIDDFLDHYEEGDDNGKVLVDSKRNVLMAVSYDNYCGCWKGFKPILEDYAKNNNLIFYHYEASGALAQEIAAGYGIKNVGTNPVWILIKDGKIIYQDVYSSSKKRFSDYDSFASFVEQKIEKPRMYYINKEQLDNKFMGDENFVLYYSRSTCNDCKFVNNNFLVNYMETRKDKVMYILDCDVPGIRYNSEGEYDETQWFTFKDDYGLSNKYNVTYGYDGGYVPTFFYYEPNGDEITSIKDGAVVFNDTLNEGRVTNTYFTEVRSANLHYLDKVETKVLEGVLVDETGQKKGDEKRKAVAKYHNPLLKAFLDLYL